MNPVSFAYEGGMLMGLAYKWMAFGVKKAGSLSCKIAILFWRRVRDSNPCELSL